MIRSLFSALLLCQAVSVSGPAEPPCQPIDTDHITGRDLIAAIPALASLPPDLPLGFSPAPGVQRIMRTGQLQQLANQFGIAATIAAPVCFAWRVHILEKQQILAALHKSLPNRDVEIEMVDQSLSPAPDGDVVFPLSGLSSESTRPAVWNGFVIYGAGKKFNTWIRARVTLHEEQIVAGRDLHAGERIDASALKKVTYNGPLRRAMTFQKENEVAGKCARYPIPSGMALTDSMLALPLDIEKTELVTVHIDCGGAHIQTQGIALEGGYRGDVIHVKNPKTGRVFRAKIDDQAVVTVVSGGTVGLVVEGKKS